jgi:glyoxylase-like metal-dependent hydrolase (beta-lactamase superfamily II)
VTDGPKRAPHPFPVQWTEPAEPAITALDLHVAIDSHAPPVLLDVRTGAERAVATLPDDTWIPLAELPRRTSEIPADRPVVVYDSFGLHSAEAVRLLYHAGHPWSAELKGGLDEYARVVDPSIPRYVRPPDPGPILLHQLPRPATGCLAYVVGDLESREAVVIDPGADPDPYLALLRERNWRLAAIVETHTHADHLAGHARLHQRTDAPIWLGKKSPALYPHRTVADGESVEFGRSALTVLETPGHTRDHVSLLVGSKVFTGDSLLLGSCGRTDLGDGDPNQLWTSLYEKLLALPDETEVLPAHFGPHHELPERYSTTIGIERATNGALTQPTREAFLQYMAEGWPPRPVDFDQIVAANLAAF